MGSRCSPSDTFVHNRASGGTYWYMLFPVTRALGITPYDCSPEINLGDFCPTRITLYFHSR